MLRFINFAGLITPPNPSKGAPNNKAWIDIKDQATIKINSLVSSLKTAMSAKSAVEDDW
jgi:hypothetical protein